MPYWARRLRARLELLLGAAQRRRSAALAGARLCDLVLGDEVALQERLESAQVVVGVVGLGAALADDLARGGDRVALRLDLALDLLELGLGLLQPRGVGPHVDDEQELALTHRLVVDDVELGERTGDVRRDADDVGADRGVVGERAASAEDDGAADGHDGGDDDRDGDDPAETRARTCHRR